MKNVKTKNVKYVKSKDGIFGWGWNSEMEENHTYFGYRNGRTVSTRTEDIIASANKIEDLCDDFIWVKGDIHYCTRYSNYQELKELTLQKEGLQLYGAIWTDKGLIYVAKMNDKGELELL